MAKSRAVITVLASNCSSVTPTQPSYSKTNEYSVQKMDTSGYERNFSSTEKKPLHENKSGLYGFETHDSN